MVGDEKIILHDSKNLKLSKKNLQNYKITKLQNYKITKNTKNTKVQKYKLQNVKTNKFSNSILKFSKSQIKIPHSQNF